MRSHTPRDTQNRASWSSVSQARGKGHGVPLNKRTRGSNPNRHAPFLPPEDWYEPTGEYSAEYRVVIQTPGDGYCHVVTEDEIRQRLSGLPEWMIGPLEVVQLSRMTRKKMTMPCYGMQWGASLYLYPIETTLIEQFARPPHPSMYNEARMYGGRWEQLGGDQWRLIWTHDALRDFYLNNILIHELGHLLDDRNRSYTDRERYAEWFALEHGYKPSRRAQLAQKAVHKRHHAK